MREYIDVMKRASFFSGIDEAEIESMLNCLGAREEKFKKTTMCCVWAIRRNRWECCFQAAFL